MSLIPSRRNKRSKLKWTVTEEVEIRQSLRTAQPYAGVTSFDHWRAPGDGIGHPRNETSADVIKYRYEQLETIANLPRYKSKGIPRELWMRNDVLFLFSYRAPIEEWTELNNERYVSSISSPEKGRHSFGYLFRANFRVRFRRALTLPDKRTNFA